MLLLGLTLAVGCRPGVGHLDDDDRGNRMVQKGYDRLNEGDYDSAILILKEALGAYPALARPHLDLAFLLHDRRRDYVRAIYHYSRYLELRPQTEKRQLIEDRIQQAMRAYGALCAPGATPGGAPRLIELEQEAENLQLQISDLVTQLAEAREQLAQERRRAEDAERLARDVARVAMERSTAGAAAAGVDAATNRVYPPVAPPVEPPVATTRPPAEVAPPPIVEDDSPPRTYTVRPGDTLSRIAQKVYGDGTEWRIIQDANRGTLNGSVNVRIGQVLVIPRLP